MPEAKGTARGETTRAALLDAAHQLFIERGYHATSMRQIAERAGLTLSGIYNHFSGKEALFEAVLLANHPYREMAAALQSAEGADAESYFRDAGRRVLAVLERHPRVLNLILIELVEFEGRHAATLAQAMLPALLEGFRRTLAYEHELRPLPLPVLLRTFLGAFFAYHLTERLIGSTSLPGLELDWLGGTLDIFLHGALRREER